MKDIQLKCSCGKVQGIAHNVTPKNGNRIICHCGDCQSFATYLGNSSTILDKYQGTDIFQMPVSNIEITQGKENIKCIKLREKWLHRWYADCCKTPIGNTMSAKMNFMWVIHNFMDDQWTRDDNIGQIQVYAFIKKSADNADQATPLIKMLPKMFYKILCWKFQRDKKYYAFYKNTGEAICKPKILSK